MNNSVPIAAFFVLKVFLWLSFKLPNSFLNSSISCLASFLSLLSCSFLLIVVCLSLIWVSILSTSSRALGTPNSFSSILYLRNLLIKLFYLVAKRCDILKVFINTPSLFNLFNLSAELAPAFSKALVFSSTFFKYLLVTCLGAFDKPTTKQWGNFLSLVFSKLDLTIIPFFPACLPFNTTTTLPGL